MLNSSQTPSSQMDAFRSYLKELETLLAGLGYQVRAYEDPSLPHFRRLSERLQTEVLEALRTYCQVLMGNNTADYKDVDMSPLVWKFLLELGVAPSRDLFETIRNEPFIQIYNTDEIQIFRSLRCFERCSFTLEELTTRRWYELWSRDHLFYYAFSGLVCKLICFIKPTKLKLDFPYHLVREVGSDSLYDFKYKMKSVSVLTKQGRSKMAVLVEDWIY